MMPRQPRSAAIFVALIFTGCRSEKITNDTSVPSASAQPADAASSAAPIPTYRIPLPDVVEVVAEGEDACARTSTGDVWCWGAAGGSVPVHIPLSGAVSRIGGIDPFCIELASSKEWLCRRMGYSAGSWDRPFLRGMQIRAMWQTEAATLLALDDNNRLLRWSAPLSKIWAQWDTPVHFVRTADDLPVASVSPNGFCFSRPGGDVYCSCQWNYGLRDPHDIPLATCPSLSAVVPVAALHGASRAWAAPGRDVCGVLADGYVDCIHNEPDGVRDTFVDRAALRALGRVKSVASATEEVQYGFTCVITETDAVSCWGVNFYHSLGEPDLPPKQHAVQMPVRIDVTKTVSLALGDTFGCALSEDHHVYCWGDNRYGQCGYGSYVGREPELRRLVALQRDAGTGGL